MLEDPEIVCMVCITDWKFKGEVDLITLGNVFYGVCPQCRKRIKLFDEMHTFIKDSLCECLDEYGTPAPQKCDRCRLLEKINDG